MKSCEAKHAGILQLAGGRYRVSCLQEYDEGIAGPCHVNRSASDLARTRTTCVHVNVANVLQHTSTYCCPTEVIERD